MTFRKILPYLLLNVAISAAAMLIVILIWNATHPVAVFTGNMDELLATSVPAEQLALPPLDQKSIEIVSVFLPGEVNYEKISLKNVTKKPVDLSGWVLLNEEGDEFTFPELTLYPDGAVDVYSIAGVNTAVELFWKASHAIWQSGKNAILLDSEGQERFRYAIP